MYLIFFTPWTLLMLVAPNLPPHQNPDPYHISKYIEKLFTMCTYVLRTTYPYFLYELLSSPVGPHCANYQWNRRPLTASGFLKQRFDSIDQLVGRFVLKLNHPLLKITLAIWHSGHQISPASIYRRGGVRVRVKTVKSSSQLLISPSGHDLVELLITLRASSDCYPRSG